MNCIGMVREALKGFRRKTLRRKSGRRKDHGEVLVIGAQKADLQDSEAVKEEQCNIDVVERAWNDSWKCLRKPTAHTCSTMTHIHLFTLGEILAHHRSWEFCHRLH